MAVRMDNSKSSSRMVGHQLWAEFYARSPAMSKFVESGRVRICLFLTDDGLWADVEAFEEACNLRRRVWPGTAHCVGGGEAFRDGGVNGWE